MKKVLGIAALEILWTASFALAVPPQQKKSNALLDCVYKKTSCLKVRSASMPLYPRVAPAARVQGTVVLHVATDGQRISDVQAVSGPAVLAQAATDNVKTWQFEAHVPTNFDITFQYRLLRYHCGPDADSDEKESVVLHLPTSVELNTTLPIICDPPAEIKKN